jgi:predicted oxidoreductase
MGKLLEQIQTEMPKFAGGKPRIQVILDEMTVEDRDDLLEALLDTTIQTMVIRNVLAQRGDKLSHSTVSRFRKDLANGIA